MPMFIIECIVVNNIRRCTIVSFEHVSLWCLLFDFHETMYVLIKYRGPIKKRNQMTPVYLIVRGLQGVWVLSGLAFMSSNFYQSYLHNETCVALTI